MNLLRTVLRVLASRILAVGIGVVGLVLFIRVLGAAQFGVFVLFQALVRSLSVVTDLGVHGAIEKRISEDVEESILGTGLLVMAGLLVPVSLVIFALRDPIDGYLGAELTTFLIVALVVEQFGTVFKRTLAGELKVGLAETAGLARQFGFYVLAVSLVLLGFGVEGLVVSMIVSWIGFSGWALSTISTPIRPPSMAGARSIVGYSKYNFVASVVGTRAYGWLDTVLIGLFLSPTAVTAYEIVWRVSKMIMLLSQSIARSLFPQISSWDAEGELAAIEQVIPTAITGGLLLVVPAIVGAALLGEEILRLVFGPAVTIATVPLVILMVGKVPEAVNNVLSRVLLGVNRPDLTARAAAVFVGLNLVLNLLLIPAFGLSGAAVATTVSFTINAVLVAYYLSRFVTIRVDYRTAGTSVLATLVMGALLVSALRIVSVDSLPTLVAMVVAGAVLYFAALLLSPSVREQVGHVID